MTNGADHVNHQHNGAEEGEHHPGPATYVKIAVTLGILTAVEVGIFYIEALGSALIPMFIALSAAKFALVAMFYMHLRYDSKLFSWMFAGGVMLAIVIALALMALFKIFS